jgi:glycosyltransferase involved in cell wall biosynthesis
MLSFVIPAFNEEFELAGTISAIRSAADSLGERYEIIVADDGSTDATPSIATAKGAVLVQIQRRQIAAARNAGAKAARGEILFFVDADTRISAVHIADALTALNGGCSGGSARVAIDGVVPRWGRIFVSVFSMVYFSNNLGAGAFLFTSRQNFERVGGFNEQLFIGEEVFFSIALKKIGRFKILPVPIVTSGRKLRMYSGWKFLSLSLSILLRGPRAARQRENCQFWYDGRRESASSRQDIETALARGKTSR